MSGQRITLGGPSSTRPNAALHQAIEQGHTMRFPIRLDNTMLHTPSGWAAQFRTRHIGDFRGWKDHITSMSTSSPG
jgi:hypothetical protein